MYSINDLLDMAKAKAGIESDRALAKALGVSNIPPYRKGFTVPNDDTAIRLAELCELPPAQVIACCHAAKAEGEAVKIWESFFKMAANMALAGVLIFTVPPAPAHASGAAIVSPCGDPYYSLCDAGRRFALSIIAAICAAFVVFSMLAGLA